MPTHSREPADGLSGLVERVTFHNEDTGFAVLKVKVKGRRGLVPVVGAVAAVSPGEWITAEGHWERNRDHGMQLRAATIRCQPPNSLEGIEKYLGSGLIRGIGPVYAKKMVAKFGTEIFNIIENASARLQDVEGIGAGRRQQIKAAWAEQKVVRDIMVFLHGHGISTSRALRVYKLYGEEAIARVRANPYLLARDIPGIGFKSADAVGAKLGFGHDSILRARGGLQHVLSEATGEGHTALPERLLLSAAAELLGVDESVVAGALEREIADEQLVAEKIAGESMVFLPALHAAEVVVAGAMRRLGAAPANYPQIDFDKALVWVQEKTGKTLSPSQVEALRRALGSRVCVVTGGPGVGKTTLLDSLLKILAAKKVRFQLCAPTGRAAKRMGESTGCQAQTIHRLLEVFPSGGFKRGTKHPLDTDLVVVDEFSMVDVQLMASLCRALPARASLILVGDPDQLPSVGPGSLLSDILASGVVPSVRLTEIFRQAEASSIVRVAHDVRHGRMPDDPEEKGGDFAFMHREEPEEIAELVLRLARTEIPRRLGLDPVRDVQVLAPMHRGSLGIRELNTALQAALNPPRQDRAEVERFGTKFRTGDKVLQTRNNYDKEVFNGDIGRISSIDPEERQVAVDFDGRRAVYEFGELDEIEPAYAISIHKSQGSEFPAVVIPLAMQHFLLLQRNLLYTGITRGKKLVVVAGQRKAFATAVRQNDTRRRHGGLLARLKESS
ncbi:MAG: ATP-dependent RecD-like DNA helicase [Chthoniobacterales bacterium]|nr:ATP-dependent RecD-like DNA helicase [Chthoniobacterales bacterium]